MISLEKVFIALFVFFVATFLYQLIFGNTMTYGWPTTNEGFVPLLPASTGASSHLLDYYPNLDPTGKLGDKDSSQLWQKYPIFQVGSYDQTTNNIRYPVNPDVGQCRPESMCNVLYGDREEKPVIPTPPVDNGKVRVGFFTTETLPFY